MWALLVFVIDFISKRLVLTHEVALRARIDVIGDLVRFIYVRNSGSAMGLFPVGRLVLIGVSLLASVFIIYLYRTTDPRQRVRLGAMGAILGGALGNLVDRVFYAGQVVDFIDVGLGTHRFYTFNVADIGVSVGGAILFLCILFEGRGRNRDQVATELPATPSGGSPTTPPTTPPTIDDAS
jgi:signal peptidase II